MFSRKFSLDTAYTAAFRTVLNNFMFFLIAMLVGGFAIAIAFLFLGFIDLVALRHHFGSLIPIFHKIATSATGLLHYGGTTIHESVSTYVSPQVAQQLLGQNVGTVDIKTYDKALLLSALLPAMIALKMVVDMISIGWTKIALDLNVKQAVSLRYLFSYYYLVPRVFVVNLVVGVLTLLGTMLFIIPGIFVYQRLRFAKFFIIDKNLSIVKGLQASWALTEGATLQLFGFTILSVLLESFGAALLILWVFISPLQNQAEANVYRQMLENR